MQIVWNKSEFRSSYISKECEKLYSGIIIEAVQKKWYCCIKHSILLSFVVTLKKFNRLVRKLRTYYVLHIHDRSHWYLTNWFRSQLKRISFQILHRNYEKLMRWNKEKTLKCHIKLIKIRWNTHFLVGEEK